MKGYRQLPLPQRYEIFALKKAGHSQVAIADLVGVHASTVSRELRRNKSLTGYSMLRRLIDKLSSAVFNRAVRPSGLDALSGWSNVNYGSNGAPSRSPIG